MTKFASEENVEGWLQNVDTSAESITRVSLAILLIEVYLFSLIFSTTDEQLIRNSQIPLLPLDILDIKVSILTFYCLSPWLIFLLHFFLLFQFCLFADQLHALDAAVSTLESYVKQSEYRKKLPFFPLIHMLVGHHHSRLMRVLSFVIVWATMIFLPLLLLLGTQIQFLSYHSERIVWSQRAAVVLDILLLWIFWPRIVLPKESVTPWWQQVTIAPLCWLLKLATWIMARGKLRKLLQAINERLRIRQAQPEHIRGSFVLFVTTLASLAISLGAAVIPGEALERWTVKKLESYVPKNWLVENEILPTTFILTSWLFDTQNEKRQHVAPFHRNLLLAEKVLVQKESSPETIEGLSGTDEKEGQEAHQETMGIELIGRDLRFADLRGAILSKADLRNAQLQFANLFGARLQGATLQAAQLQGAILIGAQLQGADLEAAELQGAVLWDARLQGANLEKTRLQAAILRGALMQGSELKAAQLQGAVLYSASVGSADFTKTVLNLSDLRNLDRTPLTQKQYEKIEDKFSPIVLRDKLDFHRPERLHKRIGQSDTLSAAVAQDILCDNANDISIRKCFTEDLVTLYERKLIDFLVNQSCKDTFLSYSAAMRAQNYALAQLSLQFGTNLAEALLRSNCEGHVKLPWIIKENLRKVIEEKTKQETSE